jgi:hypothetical protein
MGREGPTGATGAWSRSATGTHYAWPQRPETKSALRSGARLALLAFVLLSLVPAAAWSHAGNPNFRSKVTAIRPALAGVQFEVRNYDDRLYAVNHSGRELRIDGYEGEPYIRILADGSVQVNKRSKSYYLNEDRYAKVEIPADASDTAPPRWELVDRTGRYEWHDHRIHYMSKDTPPQVKDEGKAAKIFDWKVPVELGPRHAAVVGTLSWEPSDSGAPKGAYFALAALVVASGLLFAGSRRIRRRGDGGEKKGGGGGW